MKFTFNPIQTPHKQPQQERSAMWERISADKHQTISLALGMQQSDEKQKLLELIINPDVVSFKAFFSTSKIHNLALNGSVICRHLDSFGRQGNLQPGNQSQDHSGVGGWGSLCGDHPWPLWRHSGRSRVEHWWTLEADLESAGVPLLKNSVSVISRSIKDCAYRVCLRARVSWGLFFFFPGWWQFSPREKKDRRVSPLLHSKNKSPICPFILLFWSHFLKDNALFNYFSVTSTPHCQKKPLYFSDYFLVTSL